jgi:putative ABC transport system substrate-binding protein
MSTLTKSKNLASRFALLAMLSVALLACGAKEPQSYTVGILSLMEAASYGVVGFQEGLAELGYVEGENITYIYDGPSNDMETLAVYAQRMVDQQPDLVFTISRQDIAALRALDPDIPIIFVAAYDVVAEGFAETLQRPGKNASGVQFENPFERTIDLMLVIDPTIKTVYLPYSGQTKAMPIMGDALEAYFAKRGDGIELIAQQLDVQDVLENGLTGVPEDFDHIAVPPDAVLAQAMGQIIALAMERKVATSVPVAIPESAGVFLGYGGSLDLYVKQAARMADKVLRGQYDINELPVEPGEYYLSINLEMAQAIGLEVPDRILQQAEWIFRPQD